RRVEDLQLVVESYQKKLNLTKPDTYRSDLKRKEASTAYSNLRGFIYQNKDKKNRLMRIDELYKFSDGMLTDDRTALDDHAKDEEDYEELGEVCWRKAVRGRLKDATKDHMIYRFRLKIHIEVCLLAIRVTWARPMRMRDFSMWDWGTLSHGVLVKRFGTVPVWRGVRERAVVR
nr:hypothetical protein [Tanacetum cinerariifolium]